MRLTLVVALATALGTIMVGFPATSRSAEPPPAGAVGPGLRGSVGPGLVGTVGRGLVAIDFTNPAGKKMSVSGQAAFEQRDDLFRLDLTSLSISSGSTPGNQIAPMGGFSLVVDRKQQRYVIWSAARHAFYWGDLPKPPSPLAPSAPTPAPKPSASPRVPPRAAKSPFENLKDLKAFSFGIDMSGHGTTNGHPSTGFSYRLHSETNDGKINDLRGELQTADDLAGLPLLFTANVAAQSGANGTIRIELTSIEKRDPEKIDFLVPSGYTAVKSPLELLLPRGALTP